MGKKPTQKTNLLWPLYGAGLENFGKNNKPIEVPMPEYGPDELLVRHDACGLCFSDIKIIRLGQDHPRIYRDMQKEPVVMGHEVCMTIVGVGENLVKQYNPGDTFILQADIFIDGIGYAYGYEIQGGLSEYNVVDQRVLNGDHGNYLIPVHPTTGYAEAALVEPWACVIAAYYLQYRSQLKSGGTAWFIGPENERTFMISSGFGKDSHPDKIILTKMVGAFGRWLRKQAKVLGIHIVETDEISAAEKNIPAGKLADDIILLDPSADLIEQVSPFLAYKGILTLATEEELTRPVNLDIGRVHYNRWIVIGGNNSDIANIYSRVPVRSSLKSDGKAFFVGSGGPMGRMHVQHAIESSNGPKTIVCSDISDERLSDLCESYAEEAKEKGIAFICVNPMDKEEYENEMAQFKSDGFDDIIVLAPIPAVISDTATWLAERGVINIFAGVARGTTAVIDLNDTIFRDTRVIGHSASSVENMITMLNEVESCNLSSNRSVAAIGSLEAAKDGLQALEDAVYPGKVVIFPNIKPLPLTAIKDLKTVLPEVYSKLKNGREWSKSAEKALFNILGKD